MITMLIRLTACVGIEYRHSGEQNAGIYRGRRIITHCVIMPVHAVNMHAGVLWRYAHEGICSFVQADQPYPLARWWVPRNAPIEVYRGGLCVSAGTWE